jgi:hypothetical protein
VLVRVVLVLLVVLVVLVLLLPTPEVGRVAHFGTRCCAAPECLVAGRTLVMVPAEARGPGA